MSHDFFLSSFEVIQVEPGQAGWRKFRDGDEPINTRESLQEQRLTAWLARLWPPWSLGSLCPWRFWFLNIFVSCCHCLLIWFAPDVSASSQTFRLLAACLDIFSPWHFFSLTSLPNDATFSWSGLRLSSLGSLCPWHFWIFRLFESWQPFRLPSVSPGVFFSPTFQSLLCLALSFDLACACHLWILTAPFLLTAQAPGTWHTLVSGQISFPISSLSCSLQFPALLSSWHTLLSPLLFPTLFSSLLSSLLNCLQLSTLHHISTAFTSLKCLGSSLDIFLLFNHRLVSVCACVCFSVQPLPAAHGGTLRFCLLGASHACVGGRPPNQATVLVGTTRSTYRPWSWWLGTESNHHLPNAVTIIWISISWQLSVYIHSPIYLRLYLHTYLSIHLSIYLSICRFI